MIISQILLIIILLAMGAHFVGTRNSSRTKALKKLFLILIIPTAAFVVLFPSTSTDVAQLVGIGRGADLLLYGAIIIIIFQAIDGYVRSQNEQRRTVLIVRRLALLEAEQHRDSRKEERKK